MPVVAPNMIELTPENDRDAASIAAEDGMAVSRFDGTQRLLFHHREEDCTPPCAIHAPSDHHMVDWSLHWRGDRRIFERICPCGIGHPDPDDANFRANNGDGDTVHGCCGCCRRPLPA